MVQIDDERAEPVMRRIEQLVLKELEEVARRLRDEMERRRREALVLAQPRIRGRDTL